MSNIDKRELREAAEKATKGRWAVEFDDEIYSTDGVNHEQIAMVFSENEARDAAFIAAANPATVLELLDELEKMQAQSSKWCEAFHKAVSVGARYEERIAELEAREQKNLAEERQRVIDGLCTIGETAWEIEEYMKEWDAKHPHEAATAGIGVKGE